MATDFSISTLLDLPSEESEELPKLRNEMKIPTSRSGYLTPVDEFHPSGKHSSLSGETNHPREAEKPSSSVDLTRFPACDFTTIVIPKKHTKPRRKRTAFSNIQLHFLEQFFQKKAYPSSQERNFIGSILNIGSGQVKTWYQNRRTKMKKNKVFGDYGFDAQEATSSSVVDANVHCIDYENCSQPRTSLLDSSHSRTNVFDMRCGHQPTWVGSNLLLLQQQSMFGPHQ